MSNKKKILVLTSIYPGQDVPNNFTPVVHYFVKEWIKRDDFDIKVIHLPAYFPKVFYIVPNRVKNFVSSKLGFPFPKICLSNKIKFDYEGVSVYRMPIFKKIPMGKFSESVLKEKAKEIIALLDEEHFKPDIIIGHWFNPQVYISVYLKENYNCRTILTLHETTDKYKGDSLTQSVISHIDKWGYRNKNIQQNFLRNFGIMPTVQCFSGIPEVFVENPPVREFEDIRRFIFVGGLLQRKYPDVLMKSVLNCYGAENFHIDIIGDGPMMPNLTSLINKWKANSGITLWGRKSRSEILHLLDKSDVFVMISKYEAFGLVYIEAMARGCIVIASKNEGMEGIIKHGHNGFLCEAGNQQELESVIQNIRHMPASKLMSISERAIKTASELTDGKVADKYIYEVLRD